MGSEGPISPYSVPKRGFTWEEVKKHNTKDERWLVIDNQVYNITAWSKRHPGGPRVIGHFAGQDATLVWQSFHKDLNFVRKFMRPLHLGYILPEERKICEVDEDFKKLRTTAEEMIQLGWLQHDYGHLSVFKSSRWNHIFHYFTSCFMKGMPKDWWNHMHFQHHAKPNVIMKDPDTRLYPLFVLGDVMPIEIAMKTRLNMPFDYQHRYFFALGPPLLFPVVFHLRIAYYVITRKLFLELIIMGLYALRFGLMFMPFFGWRWILIFYFAQRWLESHWFTWVTQSNHIPMQIKHDEALPWVPLQLNATCNIEQSFFNDWFTGHLNFQIEHHLFPTMPRHNYYKIAPLVKSLCEKHGVKYESKQMSTAFMDIIRSLQASGELWKVAYMSYNFI